MVHKGEAETNRHPLPIALLRVLEALPYAVSWATLPDGRIRYTNPEFERMFGHGKAHFPTVERFIESAYLFEHQRVMARTLWFGLEVPQADGTVVVPDMEVDVLAHDGAIRTVLHSGVILAREKIGVAIFKDFSAVAPSQRLLREIAQKDDLTGIANRRGLRERWQIETHSSPGGKIAFLMLDLDDFKPVNDRYGHAVGDAVLKVIAKRLTDAVRQSDLVCRLGGDEFGVLLVAPGDTDRIAMVCNRILKSVGEPMIVDGVEILVQASIGGCLYPDQARDKREILQRADSALYQGKAVGKKGSWQWYDENREPTPASLPSVHQR